MHNVFMFSGQGCQYYQMGREFYKNNRVYFEWMERLDRFVKESYGFSVLEVIYQEQNKKWDIFDRLIYTHPAIFMAEYAMVKVLENEGIRPDCVIGSSLGEFTAYAVAGIIKPETMLNSIVTQAQCLEKKCEEGRMISILDEVQKYSDKIDENEELDIACINSNQHFIVSGSAREIQKLEIYVNIKGGNYQILPVRYGFHSKLIESAKIDLMECFKKIEFRRPLIRVLSSVGIGEKDLLEPSHMWDVLRKPINFMQNISAFKWKETCQFIDLSPTGTMANIVRYSMGKDAKVHFCMSQFPKSFERFQNVVGKIKSE